MKDLRFSWYAPTHGDGHIIGGRSPGLEWSPGYIDDIGRATEAAGFDMILLPTGPGCADPIVTAAHLAHATHRLRFLIAVRPGSCRPTVLSKALATLDHATQGRVCLNVVTGGSPRELAMDGDYEPHDQRYIRTDEFVEIFRALGEGEAVTRTGEFFSVTGASLSPEPFQDGGVPIYVGGASEGAIAVASRYGDVYLMWGEPSEAVSEQFSRVRSAAEALGRRVRCGMRINLVVEETSQAAWQRAAWMLDKVDTAMAERAHTYISGSDSTALNRIQELREAQTDRDAAFWTGMVPYRSGNSTALVGSPSEVVESLCAYVEAGVEEFIFSSYPHHETVGFIGQTVLEGVRSYYA